MATWRGYVAWPLGSHSQVATGLDNTCQHLLTNNPWRRRAMTPRHDATSWRHVMAPRNDAKSWRCIIQLLHDVTLFQYLEPMYHCIGPRQCTTRFCTSMTIGRAGLLLRSHEKWNNITHYTQNEKKMEEGLVNPYWLVNTRTTPSFLVSR